MYGALLHSSCVRSIVLYVRVLHGKTLYDRVLEQYFRYSGIAALHRPRTQHAVQNTYALICIVWYCGSHFFAIHHATHTILGLVISFVSVCHGPVYTTAMLYYCPLPGVCMLRFVRPSE